MPLALLRFSTLLSAPAFAQSVADEPVASDPFEVGDDRAPAYRITDAATVDSTSSLWYASSKPVLEAKYTKAFVADMIAANDSYSWPPALRTAKQRAKYAAEITQVVAYRIAVLPSQSSVRWIPADENQGLSPKLRPTQDLFVIVWATGVAPAEGARALPDGSLLPPPTVVPEIDVAKFGTELDALIVALASDFTSIRGAVVPDTPSARPGLQPTVDVSTIPLDGARDTSFWGKGKDAVLLADYGDYTDPKQADAIVEELIAAIDAAPKPCRRLVKDRLVTESTVRSYWLPFDPGGAMAPGLANMVLELTLRKGLAMDANKSLVDSYSVTLRVRRQ